MDSERAAELEALKKIVIERYQHDLKHEKYVELQEKLRKIDARNPKKAIFDLNKELESLNYDPVQKVVAMGIIQQQAQELISHFEASEAEFMTTDLIACMMCEVARVNFLNFLNTFQVTVGESHSLPSNSQDADEVSSQITILNEQILVLKSDLIVKVDHLPFLFVLLTSSFPSGARTFSEAICGHKIRTERGDWLEGGEN